MLINESPLGDGISKVELLDRMGSDLTVVNAARVSMGKVSTELDERDEKLINYLAKHGHWTPFSQPQLQFRIKMPIFVARQWFKHQVGFTRNEISRRYVSDAPEIYIPKEWRAKADNVKQGSSEAIVAFEDIAYGWTYKESYETTVTVGIEETMRLCTEMYEELIGQGICPEQARMVLPQSMYTEFVETASLAAYARLAKQRLDPHAQLEIRLYAEAIAKCLSTFFPYSWKALSNNY